MSFAEFKCSNTLELVNNLKAFRLHSKWDGVALLIEKPMRVYLSTRFDFVASSLHSASRNYFHYKTLVFDFCYLSLGE